MDNKAYLDSIAVKGKDTSKASVPILSPMLIKIIAVGVVLAIAMMFVGSLLNSKNKELKITYDKIYYTYNQLSQGSGPLYTYQRKLKSSTVRAITSQLQTSIINTNNQLKNAAGQIKVTVGTYDQKATEEVTADLNYLESEFESGFYAGTLDKSYATALYLQLSKMIAAQSEARQQPSFRQRPRCIPQRPTKHSRTVQKLYRLRLESQVLANFMSADFRRSFHSRDAPDQ